MLTDNNLSITSTIHLEFIIVFGPAMPKRTTNSVRATAFESNLDLATSPHNGPIVEVANFTRLSYRFVFLPILCRSSFEADAHNALESFRSIYHTYVTLYTCEWTFIIRSFVAADSSSKMIRGGWMDVGMDE